MKRRPELNNHFANLLSELARLLLDNGVTLSEFKSAAEEAFVSAASGRAKLRNARVNQSALAAITGLTRGQVRLILGRKKKGISAAGDRISQTLTGWATDSEFASRKGRPRALPLKGARGSFEELVRRYGGDVTPRALRQELQRLGKATVTTTRISPVVGASKVSGLGNLESLSAALSAALSSPRETPSRVELKATCVESTYKTLTRKGNAILRRRAAQGMQAFLADLQTATAAAEDMRPRNRRSAGKMSKLSVLLITQD